MTWDNSPWAIEDGQSSADLGRLVANLATNGHFGVHGPTDLKVRAKDVPGGAVLVGPGAVTVPCRSLGKTRQSYIGLNPNDDELIIPATGSSGPRSDLIVARVENPITGEPWNPAEDPLSAQYIFTRRYTTGVTTSTKRVEQVDPSASAFTLARIDIPANTGTITNAMITDLRGKPDTGEPPLPSTPMASASQDVYRNRNFGRDAVDDVLPYTAAAYTRWPDWAVMAAYIPSTATEAVIDFRVECEQRPTSGQPTNKAHAWGVGRVRMNYYDATNNFLYGGVTPDVEFDKDYYGGGSPTTVSIPIGGTMPMPHAVRGCYALFVVETAMYQDANTRGRLVVGRGSYIRGHIHFNVRPV